ncbi:MAG TPA: Ig-like domain-containing protein [Kofleriaceae bacterium]|jgi:hypothetical protein|nr:Ig-like domain-containing protein [Kofleriaceae bacterium]
MRFAYALLAVAACGKVQSLADAQQIDAVPAIDADPHGPVTVTVLNTDQSGTPVQGVPVVFFNPDGTMVGKSASDAQGKATATVLPGANVSVVWPKSATQYQVATIYAIKPNDDLVVGFRNPDPTEVGTFQVTFDPVGGATSYQIFGPCGTADAKQVLHFIADCKTDTFDIYIVASNANGLVAWNSKSNVAFSTGTTKLDAAGWQFNNQFTVHYSNVPAEITQISASHVSGFPGGYEGSNSGAPANNQISLAINAPGGGTNAWVTGSFSRGNMGGQIVRQRVAGASSTYGLDVGANLLPWLDTPALDASTQKFSITSTGTGTYDTYLADATYSRTVGQTTINYEWIILTPTIGDYTLPTLPADVGDVNPKTTDTINNLVGLAIDDDGDGWDSVRAHIFDEFRGAILGSSAAQQLRITISQNLFN